jgi:hypothetical protein
MMKLCLTALAILITSTSVAHAKAPGHGHKSHKRDHALKHVSLKGRSAKPVAPSRDPKLFDADKHAATQKGRPVLRASATEAPNRDRHTDEATRKDAKKRALVLAHAESHGEPELSASASRKNRGFVKVDLRSNGSKDPERHILKVEPKPAPALPTCNNAPVEFRRGEQSEKLVLTECDGTLVGKSQARLSALMQPLTPSTKKSEKLDKTEKTDIKSVDARLLYRLQSVAEHFSEQGRRIEIVSGYRPGSKGSYHSHARAVDIRVEGVKNEDLVAYCRSLIDTGCGYYPNSSFVHIDSRDPGVGHVFWIDASGPGQTPRYVASWPENAGEAVPSDRPIDANESGKEPTKEQRQPLVEIPSVVSPDAQ